MPTIMLAPSPQLTVGPLRTYLCVQIIAYNKIDVPDSGDYTDFVKVRSGMYDAGYEARYEAG